MSSAVETPSHVRVSPHNVGATGAVWDAAAVLVLAAIWAALLPFRFDAVPLQLWDESRNANNALEMALHGRWLTPTYAGAVDHWNTKPPLLIWMMAALLRTGLPPLVALRAPSWLAAAATAALLWAVPRFTLRDRLAAVAAPMLLLGAVLYVGPHAARTGDYDALEAAFVLAYVLCLWRALEDGRGAWVLTAALLMAVGALTKGVAALLPLPGLALYALGRRRQALALLGSPLAWTGAAVFCVLAGGYYVVREGVDPGYLAAVVRNEVTGRFLTVLDNHRGDPSYYLVLLARTAEPCAAASLLAVFAGWQGDGRRRRLALAAALASLSLIALLSVARSKLRWYAVPAVPLLSLLGGIGLSDALGRLRRAAPAWGTPAAGLAGALLVAGCAWAIAANQACPRRCPASVGGAHLRYGEYLDAVRRRGFGPATTVLDTGFGNDAGFAAYDPMLAFYAGTEGRLGLKVRVAHALQPWGAGEGVGGCDSAAIAVLRRDPRLSPVLTGNGCVLFRAAAAPRG